MTNTIAEIVKKLNLPDRLLVGVLAVTAFYTAIHVWVIPPLIHQETGMALLMALVKYGHGIANGDPWWSASPASYDFAPPIRLWMLYHLNETFGNFNVMAAVMSTIYAAIAVVCWWFFARGMKIASGMKVIFAIYATLPFSYDLWTVGLSQGFKDITFIVIFTPLILLNIQSILDRNRIMDVVILGLVSSAYFLLHPTQAILVLQVPFVVLLLASIKGARLRNAAIFVISLLPLCVPYFYLLSKAPLLQSVDYTKYLEIWNYRHGLVFPHNKIMYQWVKELPIVGEHIGFGEANWILAIAGMASFILYVLLVSSKSRRFRFYVAGFVANAITCCLLGYYQLSIAAAMGWYVLVVKRCRSRLEWFAFLPCLLLTLSCTAMAFWAAVGMLAQRPYIDTQYLLHIVIIPYLIVGSWCLIEYIMESLRSYSLRLIMMGSMVIVSFLWFWGPHRFITLLIEGGVILMAWRCIPFIVLAVNNSGKSIRLEVTALVASMAIAAVVGVHYAGTPYSQQKSVVDETTALVDAIKENVPVDGRILSAPYYVRLMTRRYVYWTKKDLNVYASARDINACMRWYDDALAIDEIIDSRAYEELVQMMKMKMCDYIVLQEELRDPRFMLLYAGTAEKLYKVQL